MSASNATPDRSRGGGSGSFQGVIEPDVRDSTSDWGPYLEPVAPAGSPNVLFIVWDDMGFGSWDLYGGLVEMPNMRRLADLGVRFTQFHTTALCSPTRSSLLTGRNAQNNGMGTVGEFSDGFPNLSCLIPAENGFVSEILRERGYNTMAVGKWHLTPASELSMGASKRTWPLSRGFDRYYGFLGGLTDQWYPDLTYDNHPVDPPARPEDGYHLSADLVDRTIEFIRDTKATAPDKPWFTYFAPGACHAPHHVFTEWADRYAGRFDDGYEAYREQALARQKELGLVPESTELPPINPYADATGVEGEPWNASDIVRPWAELSDDERRLFTRQAEVFAGFASYTDAQVGRLLDYLEDSGQLDNTLVVALSDNGTSAEGGPNGSVNENRWYNDVRENLEENLRQLDRLGDESTHPHFSNGWAMAFNTPFKMYKTNASFEGGVADPLVIAWPAGIAARGEVRDQYVHVTDVLPTVLDCLGMPAPTTVNNLPQTPMDGVSFHAALGDAGADTGKREQFYCMLGTRGVWADGWHASSIHPPAPSRWRHFDQDRWELYDIRADRNQAHDLARERPGKLEELIALWDRLARENNGYPLDDRNAIELVAVHRPSIAGTRTAMTLHPGAAPVPERSGVEILNRSFRIVAEIEIAGDDSSCVNGVVYSLGARFGGHALFVVDGRPHYVYNWLGEEEQLLTTDVLLPTGRLVLGVDYRVEGVTDHVPHGTATLHVNEQTVATSLMRTQPGYFSLAGEGATVGREVGQPVSSAYQPPFTFTGGTIRQVVVDTSDDGYDKSEAVAAAAFARD